MHERVRIFASNTIWETGKWTDVRIAKIHCNNVRRACIRLTAKSTFQVPLIHKDNNLFMRFVRVVFLQLQNVAEVYA